MLILFNLPPIIILIRHLSSGPPLANTKLLIKINCMKKLALLLFIVLSSVAACAQITYIGILNHNTGTGSNNLFNNYVSVAQQCFVDWEVYADGMTNMEACGFRSDSRLVLRRMDGTDPSSVVASTPIIVPGTCGGKNGNNDKYYADLGPYINKPGRYSLEIQADLPNQTNAFGNASTKTTFNYACPSAYYLTGTGGPTGNYYTPAGACAGGPGLSDPVGGASADSLAQIFTALKFFTVGEVGTYRRMVIFDGNFYDLADGRFQPGNPAVPGNLDGMGNIPAAGICPVTNAPQLSIGGEINIFKRTDCGNADVTGGAVFYRVYKEGNVAPAFDSFPLLFKDDCGSSTNGPEGNNFPTGGSCQNTNNILDQRWQSLAGAANILPSSFALSDTGRWKIDLYTETYMKDCSAEYMIDKSGLNTTSFTVNNPLIAGSPCSGVIPVLLSSFTVSGGTYSNLLAWTVEEASQVTRFEIQRSFDGYIFSNAGLVDYNKTQSSFRYNDAAYPGKTVFYRLIIHELSGKKYYSTIVRVSAKTAGIKITVQASAEKVAFQLENFSKGKFRASVINTAGTVLAQKDFSINAPGNSSVTVPIKNALPHGIYYLLVRDEHGTIISKSNYFYGPAH